MSALGGGRLARLGGAVLVAMAAVSACASPSGSATSSSSSPPSTPAASAPPSSSAPARTDWYGADPKDLAAALGATGYKATAKDTAAPFDYRAGTASFSGVTVGLATFATAADEAKNATAQAAGAASLPAGSALYYAVGTGGQVSQELGPDGLTATFTTQSKATAEAAIAALPGFTLRTVQSTQK